MSQFYQSLYSSLPQDPGIYQFLNNRNEIIYVGKAANLKKRVSSYFTSSDLDPKTKVLVSQIKSVKTIIAGSEIEAFLLEAKLIKKYLPRYNRRMVDGKNYPLVKITHDEFPKILLARQENDKKATYFGPFPNSGDLRLVLKTIRKIFPYINVANHAKRICLYNHLGLCPCPITLDSEEKIKIYKKNIKYISHFLNGETKKIIKELEDERNDVSKNEEYEKAAQIQKKIEAIKLITSPIYKPFLYELNPNFRNNLIEKELTELKEILNKNGIDVDNLKRIECYDISNTMGTNATGSMVVFTNGQRDSASYRRFKIKNLPKVIPNDFEMMREVLERRLNHKDWESPSLMIVDGGKGQITSGLKALNNKNKVFPLVGLAKREEIIITADFIQIKLPRNSNALNLVRRIRDEAHRFAITYHKKLRSKAIFE